MMKLLLENWRSYITVAVLREARITPDNLPEDVTFKLRVSSNKSFIHVHAHRRGLNIGTVTAGRVKNETSPCRNAYEVVGSGVDLKGIGPLLYDIVMEVATEFGGGLMSDRLSVSDDAQRVWSYYQNNRPDVERLQLDSPQDDITKNVRFDNCNVMISKNLAGEDVSQWKDYPLSGVYRKPGMETIHRLMDMGKIEVKGMDIAFKTA